MGMFDGLVVNAGKHYKFNGEKWVTFPGTSAEISLKTPEKTEQKLQKIPRKIDTKSLKKVLTFRLKKAKISLGFLETPRGGSNFGTFWQCPSDLSYGPVHAKTTPAAAYLNAGADTLQQMALYNLMHFSKYRTPWAFIEMNQVLPNHQHYFAGDSGIVPIRHCVTGEARFLFPNSKWAENMNLGAAEMVIWSEAYKRVSQDYNETVAEGEAYKAVQRARYRSGRYEEAPKDFGEIVYEAANRAYDVAFLMAHAGTPAFLPSPVFEPSPAANLEYARNREESARISRAFRVRNSVVDQANAAYTSAFESGAITMILPAQEPSPAQRRPIDGCDCAECTALRAEF